VIDVALHIAARPQVLLFDELTASVAQRKTEAFGPMLRQVRDRTAASLSIVEHDLTLLIELCDRVYVTEEGSLAPKEPPRKSATAPVVIASCLGTDTTAIERSGVPKVY